MVDFKKVFDSVSFDFIMILLNIFGFGPFLAPPLEEL